MCHARLSPGILPLKVLFLWHERDFSTSHVKDRYCCIMIELSVETWFRADHWVALSENVTGMIRAPSSLPLIPFMDLTI